MLTPPPSAAIDGPDIADVLALQFSAALPPSPSAEHDHPTSGFGCTQRTKTMSKLPQRSDRKEDPWRPDDVKGMERRLGETPPARLVEEGWRSGAKITAFTGSSSTGGRTVNSFFSNL